MKWNAWWFGVIAILTIISSVTAVGIGVATQRRGMEEAQGRHGEERSLIEPVTPADSMPEEMDIAIREVATRVFPAQLVGSDVAAFDGMGAVVGPESYSKASAFNLWLRASQSEFLSVRVSYAPSEAEGDPNGHCAIGLELGMYSACSTDRLSDGSLAVYKTRTISLSKITADAPVVIVSVKDAGGRTDVWSQRSVEVIRNGTTIAFAADAVLAGGTAPTLSDKDLLTIATDSDLHMTPPPSGKNGCGTWTSDGSISVEC